MSTLVTQVQTFPGYHSHHNPPQAERFERALRRYLTRKVSKINKGEHYLTIKIRNYGTFLLHFLHFMNMIPFPLRLDLKLWWEYAAPGECHYTLSTVSFSWGLKHRNVWNFKFPGHFFVRSTDLLSLPNVNPDSAFGMQVQREHTNYKISQFLWNMEFFMICVGVDRRGPQRLTRGEFFYHFSFQFEIVWSNHWSNIDTHALQVSFQAALLYTSSKGERRIRFLILPFLSSQYGGSFMFGVHSY